MKTKLFTLLLAVAASIGTIFAESGTCGELIKAVHTGSKTADVTGIVGGSVDKNIASDGKFGGAGKFWGLTLADGVTFAEGDILNVHVSTAAGQGTIAIYADKNGENLLYNTQTVGEEGDNLIELPAALDGRATFYICRTSDNNWNGCVDTISVTRDCSTEPKLAVSPEFVRLKATLTEPSVSETVTFTGKNLTPGTYNLVLTNVAGLSVNPTSVTVPENGKLSAEVTLTYTSAEDVMADDAELSLTIGELSAAVSIEYAAKVTKQYATSLNFEQLVLDYGKSTSAEMALETANIDYNNIDQLDSLNAEKANKNYPYLGLKLKKTDASLGFWLRQGSKVNLKFGNIGADFNVYFGDGVMPVTSDMANMQVSDSNVVSCEPVAEDTYVSIVCGSTKTLVIKQIMIDEDIKPIDLDPGVDPKDDDATIKSLSINGVAITREGTTYAYEVPADVDLAEVEVVYELNSAKATGDPASGFKVPVPAGEGAAANEQTLIVTAENGAQVEYIISVTSAYRPIINDGSNIQQGHVTGTGSFAYMTQHELTAVPNYGYHFVQWSDGVTDNPRTIVLTQDTTFIAEFAKNTYTITTESSNPEWGRTEGDTSALYLEQVEISAVVLQYGYHFVRWSDNNTQNPRTYTITADATLTAIFAKNTYNITKNAEHGTISGNSSANYLDEVTLTVNPDYGYHFTQWSDGVTDNPRAFILTQDTAFTAEFAVDKSGSCGDELALTWTYDDNSKELTISSEGSLNSNYTFGVEAPTHVEKLVIAEGVTSVGNSAFANYTTLKDIYLASTIKRIYEQAFYNCENLENIYCYRAAPCVVYSDTFDGIDKFACTLHVPAASIDLYKAATGWCDFYYIVALPDDPSAIDQIDSSSLQGGERGRLILRNGQILILRGDKTYTLQGQELR